ncbi:MAG TPA: sulfatase-like hydrolase/transferase [Vicinamibacterales bacterium]|nr:sulfatase-like hydrolase/transferase [Vicinamibacterales bacterium]
MGSGAISAGRSARKRRPATCACLAAALLPLVACGTARNAASDAPLARARTIVLVTIDTLRLDRVGAYGSTRGLTPALDRLAAGASRFTSAVTQVPLTLPAHATILTGLHPARHGVRTNDGFRLGPDVPTVAGALHAAGFRTAAFIGGYPLRADAGLARGFDRYDDDFLRSGTATERRADEVVDAALAWIEPHRSDPMFVWLHLFDPHSPYTPPPAFAAAHPGAPYDGEVAYADAALGRFLDRLRALGLFQDAAVFVAADHGESLGEHGERTHGTFLYDATVHIPLVVKLPGAQTARTIDAPVEAADLAPTIAALAGASLAPTDGVNLTPLAIGGGGDRERPAYAESYYQNVLLGWSPLRAVRTSRWKFIEAPKPELYDLEHDPGEGRNRIEDRGSLAAGLRRALPPAPGAQPATAANTSAEATERLRGLGYVSGSTEATPATQGVDPKDRIEVWAAIEDGIDAVDRDPAAAREAFARALRLDPGNGLVMKYLADGSFRAGRFAEAREGYRRAIAAGFRHPDTFVNLAAIAERDGRLDEARAALDNAVRLAPGDADAWNRLGLLEARHGGAEAARAAFERAMSAAPDRAEPYYNLALVEAQQGHEQAAQAKLEEALRRKPAYPEARFELGTIFLRQRQAERALTEYRAALAVRPAYPEALFGAARAALDLGAKDEARRDYEQFVRIAPPEYARQADAARDALRRLRR